MVIAVASFPLQKKPDIPNVKRLPQLINNTMSVALLVLVSSLAMATAFCPNGCSGHGTCGANDKCTCYAAIDGTPAWTYADCSGRTCPTYTAWVGTVADSNDAHPVVECSNKGLCDRKTGECQCFENYEGIACERTVCPNSCSSAGVCFTESQLAVEAGRTYSTPWDASKNVGCVCDLGRRGPDCSLRKSKWFSIMNYFIWHSSTYSWMPIWSWCLEGLWKWERSRLLRKRNLRLFLWNMQLFRGLLWH